MLYEHYLDVAGDLDALIKSLRAHPDAGVREQVDALLERLDLLHREALVRLADALRTNGGGEALQRASQDPVVRIMLGLYDVIDLGLPDTADAVGFVPLERLRRQRESR